MITTPQTIHQILANAKMNKIKLVLVEGKDDVKKYEYILINSDKVTDDRFIDQVQIIPIEIIAQSDKDGNVIYETGKVKRYTENCEGIISALSDINKNIEENKITINIEKYLLGIIDKDVRNHREDISLLPNTLFLLPYYSIESFYVNMKSVEVVLKKSIQRPSLIEEELIRELFIDSLNNTIDFLYYPVIDSYLNSIHPNQKVLFGYKKEYGYIKDNFSRLISDEIKNELDSRKIIDKNIETFQDICKGKWFLECWLENLIENIKKLPNLCRQNQIQQCIYCAGSIESKCEYKIQLSSSKKDLLFDSIFCDQDFANCEYGFTRIIERFNQMY